MQYYLHHRLTFIVQSDWSSLYPVAPRKAGLMTCHDSTGQRRHLHSLADHSLQAYKGLVTENFS